MATSDLSRQLQSDDCILDDFESKRVVAAVLKQINDQSGDISGLANACLGALARKVEPKYIEEMCQVLLEQMKTAQDVMKRDVAYLGIKSVIQNIGGTGSNAATSTGFKKDAGNSGPSGPQAKSEAKPQVDLEGGKKVVADVVAEFLGPRLLECIQADSEEIASNGYDLLLMYVTQHGPLFPDLARMAEICAAECENPRPGIRKKAMQCLGKMSASLPIADFHAMCKLIIGKLRVYSGKKSLTVGEMQQAQSLVMSLSFIGKGAGFRMGDHVPDIVTLCLSLARLGMEDEEGHGVELVESCLMVLELCMLRCPHDSARFRTDINDAAIVCLSYDPNYTADSDMEDGDESGGGDGSDDEYSDDGFSDDDDNSWKVRRAACKALSAEIKVYNGKSYISDVYAGCQKAVVRRAVGEREETVRQEVFNVYLNLLVAIQRSDDDMAMQQLRVDLDPVALRFGKMIRKQSSKIKVCIFKVLTEMVAASPGGTLFSTIIANCATEIVSGLKEDASSALQLQILQLLDVGFGAGQPTGSDELSEKVVEIAEEVLECTRKKYFALSAASLRVCQKMVYLARPNVGGALVPGLTPLVLPLFVTVIDVLSSPEKPQEVKNAAISCTGHALGQMGDMLEGTQVESLAKDFAAMPSNAKRAKRQGSNEGNTGHMPRLKDAVSMLIERLGNETTRLSALAALKRLVESPLQLDVQGALGDAISFIKSYLKKLDRQVRIASVETLSAIMTCRASQIDQSEIGAIIDEVSCLVADDDLGVSSAVITLLGNAAVSSPEACAGVLDKTLGNIHQLLSSSTLQTSSLDKLIRFFEKAAVCATDEEAIAKDLFEFGMRSETKYASKAAAKCVASLAVSSDKSFVYVNRKLASLSNAKAVGEKTFMLFCIRELGAKRLSLENEEKLREAVVACLADESCMEAAAGALGGLASGDTTSHMEYIIDALSRSKEANLRYPLFRALDEGLKIKSRGRASTMDDSARQTMIDNIVDILIKMNMDKELSDELKVIIAECYGFAASICPQSVLPTFESQLGSDDVQCRIMALVALKSCIVDSDQDIDEALKRTWMPMAMERLADKDVSVRRSATLLLSLAAHTKMLLVKDVLVDCLPPLLEQTKPDDTLIRTIDLGPFKHKIDDGLEQRKSAYDCIGIMIGKCWGDLPDQAKVVERVAAGVGDEYEVKLKCHDLLAALSEKEPTLMLAGLDGIIAPMTKTLSKRSTPNSVRQEIDRNEDMLRSALRAIHAMDSIEGSDNVASFKNFTNAICADQFLGPRFASVKKTGR
jgi:cullin-associated NEDD8-dissociated protein 1